MYIKLHGEDHPSTANTCNNIIFVFMNKGDCDDVLVQYNRELNLRVKVLWKEYPSTANICNNITNVLMKKGDYYTLFVQYN